MSSSRWRWAILLGALVLFAATFEWLSGLRHSPALTEGEAGLPPESGSSFARNQRAKQVWIEMIRIYNTCTNELDLQPPDDRPWRL